MGFRIRNSESAYAVLPPRADQRSASSPCCSRRDGGQGSRWREGNSPPIVPDRVVLKRGADTQVGILSQGVSFGRPSIPCQRPHCSSFLHIRYALIALGRAAMIRRAGVYGPRSSGRSNARLLNRRAMRILK